MQIWVDADACPNPIKEILFRASRRVGLATTFVANQWIQVPASPYIHAVQVKSGLDVADDYIAEQVQTGDLVITADIPLASRVIEAGAWVLTPRGALLDSRNIRERLSLRNFLDELRQGGTDTGGPPPLNQRDREAFANQLDRFLAKL